MNETIKIEIELTIQDVKILTEEIENCESEYISQLLTSILQNVERKADNLIETGSKFKNANPFCKKSIKI